MAQPRTSIEAFYLRPSFVAICVLMLLSASAHGQVRSWTNAGDGAWDDPLSWSPVGIPLSDETILIINDSSKTITFGSGTIGRTVSNLILSASGFNNTLFLDNAQTNAPLQVLNNLLVQSGGTLRITNSSLQVLGVEHFGDQFLAVDGLVELQSGSMIATNRFLPDGFVATTVSVGGFDRGTLTVSGGTFLSDGMSVGGSSGAVGVVTLTGGVLDPSYISLGSANGSTGILEVTGGLLGGGTHKLSIGGQVYDVLPAMFVGDNGFGEAVISGGIVKARMVVGGQPGSIGNAVFAGGSFEGEELSIGFSSDRATAWVVGEQASLNCRLISVGGAGIAQIVVSNGVVESEVVFVGALQGLPGEFIMAGGQYRSRPITFSEGSTLEANHFNLGLAAGSTGTLWVTGGELVATNGYMAIGADGYGRMVVSNGTVLATEIRLGTNSTGRGELNIVGGTVTVLSGSTDALRIGDFAGATGTVNVLDGQLILTNSATLVGTLGFGEMIVSSGTVMTAEIEVGSGTNGIGSLTMTGGTMDIIGGLTVAASFGSTGSVTLTGGELTVTNAPLVIGVNGGAGELIQTRTAELLRRARGPLPLAGGGGSVLRANSIIVANDSVGTLTAAGGTITASSDIIVGASATATGTMVVGSALETSGDFILSHNPKLEIQLSGYEAGTEAGLITVSNTARFAGMLAVRLIGPFATSIARGASFTVLTAGTITGTFANVASGARLTTEGGEGSFLIDYSGTQLLLDDFQTGPVDTHDLALIAVKAPKTVKLRVGSSVTKRVRIQIQNRGAQDKQIDTLSGLVSLVADSLAADCPNAEVALHAGKPNKPAPLLLKANKKLSVFFDVVFDCANDETKGVGREDFRYEAALNGADQNSSNNACPRATGVDDAGCVEVKTDVILN